MKTTTTPDAAIFIDAAYLERTGKGLARFFSNHVTGGTLPKANFGTFINCLAFQMGLDPGEHLIKVYISLVDKDEQFTFCTPPDLANDFHDCSYTGNIGKFMFWSLPTLGHDTSCNAALELALYLCEEDKIPLAGVVVDLNECPEQSINQFTSLKDTRLVSFSMNPDDRTAFPIFEHEELGHSLLTSMGITPEDLI